MFRKKKPDKFALVDASKEEHGKSLGVVVSRHPGIAEAIIAEQLFKGWGPFGQDPNRKIGKTAA